MVPNWGVRYTLARCVCVCGGGHRAGISTGHRKCRVCPPNSNSGLTFGYCQHCLRKSLKTEYWYFAGKQIPVFLRAWLHTEESFTAIKKLPQILKHAICAPRHLDELCEDERLLNMEVHFELSIFYIAGDTGITQWHAGYKHIWGDKEVWVLACFCLWPLSVSLTMSRLTEK